MTTEINRRKRLRRLTWRSREHYVQRPMGQEHTITANLADELESDRLAILVLNDDDAIRLASRLANLLGYDLVERVNIARGGKQ